MSDIKKLYKVTLRGMTYSTTGVAHGISYVVSTNASDAYQRVKDFLYINDIGYERERQLDKIELIAEDCEYTDIGFMLFL